MEKEILKACLLQIENKLGWGNSDKWHSQVFIELSELIQKDTQTLLSPTTLKRIWGKVKYSNAPSISTLNTLAQFIGFVNWREFKAQQEQQKLVKPIEVKKEPKKRISFLFFGSCIAALLLFLLFIASVLNDNITHTDLAEIEFKSRPIVKGVPNTVIFDFELNGLQSDSLNIQQYWDKTKTVSIHQNQKKATAIYYYPGPFKAKLVSGNRLLKQHYLLIESEDWLGTIDYEPVPKYFDAKSSSNLSTPNSILEEIRTSKTPLVSSYHFVKDFGNTSINGLNFKTSIRTTFNEKWAICQTLKLVILGTESVLIIPFGIEGCASEMDLFLADKFWSGKENDLSMFGGSFNDYTDIEISVQNKSIVISIQEKEVFSYTYQEPLGNLVGIRYRFLGAGEVRSLVIEGDDTNKFSRMEIK